MIQVDLSAVWRIRSGGQERELDQRLIALLVGIAETGKLTGAAVKAGVSHRHAHNLVIRWGEFLGAPLVSMKQGRGTRLTPLGESVLWAGQRVQTRLVPELESLAGDFARAINSKLGSGGSALALHASYDFAVTVLRERFRAQGGDLDLQNRSCQDALDSVLGGGCSVAGFHLSEGARGRSMVCGYVERLRAGDVRLFPLVRRRQGLIVAQGNPNRINAVGDLGRAGIRIVNRQRGSGTRELFDRLLAEAGIDRNRLAGYASEEITHSAVAALVAGHVVDAGFGLEAAAARFHLGFVPIVTERYYLAIPPHALERKEVKALLAITGSPEFVAEVDRIPGYQACGNCETATVDDALDCADIAATSQD